MQELILLLWYRKLLVVGWQSVIRNGQGISQIQERYLWGWGGFAICSQITFGAFLPANHVPVARDPEVYSVKGWHSWNTQFAYVCAYNKYLEIFMYIKIIN